MADAEIWYLSFADPEKPKGTQWLGCCHVRAEGFVQAVDLAHLLGINPGGEVQGFPIPAAVFKRPEGEKTLRVLNQFLDRAACVAIWGADEFVRMPDEFTPEAIKAAIEGPSLGQLDV